jgi:hypothetical protein
MHEDYAGQGGDSSPVGATWTDIWGTTWPKMQAEVMGLPVAHLLADLHVLKQYKWPDPNDERICSKIFRLAQAFPGGVTCC